jgi:hypothetical protein
MPCDNRIRAGRRRIQIEFVHIVQDVHTTIVDLACGGNSPWVSDMAPICLVLGGIMAPDSAPVSRGS